MSSSVNIISSTEPRTVPLSWVPFIYLKNKIKRERKGREGTEERKSGERRERRKREGRVRGQRR